MEQRPPTSGDIRDSRIVRWSRARLLAIDPEAFRTRTLWIWALIFAFWLDWLVTVVALGYSNSIHELNPLGFALYDNMGVLGLAGLKAWASLIMLVVSGWIRPLRAIKVLQATLGFYTLILLWNSIQLALYM
jgi:hypothetical protein